MSNIVAKRIVVKTNKPFVDAYIWPPLMISIVLAGYASTLHNVCTFITIVNDVTIDTRVAQAFKV